MEEKELSVKKSNYLNQASYKLSVVEQKMLALLVAQIKKDTVDFKPYSLNIKDFCNLIGIENSNYTYIVSVAKSLLDRDVHFWYINEKGKEVEVNTKWLSSCVHVEGSGTVEMNFDNILKPFLLQLKNRFTLYRLENIIQLSSVFSIRIYELLKQYENAGIVKFSLEDLRKYIGIDDNQYKMYADFKRRVLVLAQNEIKQKCDIFFDFEEIKVGRSIGKLLFYITPQPIPIKNVTGVNDKKKKDIKYNNSELEEILQLLPKEYQKLSGLKKLIVEYLEKKDKNYVIRNIVYANNYSDRSNYKAYLKKALEADYGLDYQENQEAKKAIADNQKAKEKQEAKEKAEEQKRFDEEHEKHLKASKLLKALPETEYKILEKEVSEQLSERKISPSSVAWSIAFRMALESLFIERHPELFS